MKRFVDVIYFNEDNEVLLLKRSADSFFMPNKWCLPGGHVEENSSLLDNAIRELEEETNIQPITLTCIENYTFKSGDCTTIYICFEKYTKSHDIKICHGEHSQYMFVNLNELLSGKFDLMPEILNYFKMIWTH